MWVRFGYMKLCVGRDLNLGDSLLQEAVCRQRDKMWLTVGYMKLDIDRDLYCG